MYAGCGCGCGCGCSTTCARRNGAGHGGVEPNVRRCSRRPHGVHSGPWPLQVGGCRRAAGERPASGHRAAAERPPSGGRRASRRAGSAGRDTRWSAREGRRTLPTDLRASGACEAARLGRADEERRWGVSRTTPRPDPRPTFFGPGGSWGPPLGCSLYQPLFLRVCKEH